jgi:16S rRNA G966 N2-methylase RsmD
LKIRMKRSIRSGIAASDRSKRPEALDALYTRALPADRTGPLYGAFPYPTKISPEAIALFIASHTKPGDTVFDGFAGSGTTGLAALLCENPSKELRDEAKRLRLNVEWGARNAVLYELSALGAFVGDTLANPPDPLTFRKAAEEILQAAERDEGWMYSALDPDGKPGVIRYVIWSDVLQCPNCEHEISLWDACVSRSPAKIASRFVCPSCSEESSLDAATRLRESVRDDVLGKARRIRARRVAWLYGTTGRKTWSRPATKEDLKLVARVAKERTPKSIPVVEIPWGDLYRRGYHQGITHVHHFYTRRNLIVFAKLWERTEKYSKNIREALRFWLLSYNASHATIMTRVVAKTGQKDLVVTSAQPGVLYVSGLPVEKNLLSGLTRKLSTITQAFSITRGRKGRVEVHQRSSCKLHLPDRSIDYVFTDPPFGGNIPYAEVNFINEAWLGRYTTRGEEAIVSEHQQKTLVEYQDLLTKALSEVRRILKRSSKATLVFHSATAEVWNALQASYQDAGLGVECAGVLDKTQGSFKQVTTAGAVRGDPVLLLGRKPYKARSAAANVWQVAEFLRREAALTLDPSERSAQRLYSRLVTHYLSNNQQVPLDADSFYRWHASQPLEIGAVAQL